MSIKSYIKGWIGEFGINLAGKIALSKKDYHRFHNVTLETDDGTTQIDHVFISRFGIFVVETKNLSGWIFGGEHDKQWTQKFPKASYKFQNPLRQNYAHIKALESIMPAVPADAFHSVIAMCGEHIIKTKKNMPRNVTRGMWFAGYIRGFKTEVLSNEQVNEAINAVTNKRLPATRKTNKKHVEYLAKKHNLSKD